MLGGNFSSQYQQNISYGGKVSPSGGTKQFYGSGEILPNGFIYQNIGGVQYQVPIDQNTPIYLSNLIVDNISMISDKNLKSDIINIPENKTKSLFEINPTQFTFKSDIKKKIHYGFIAQDLEKIYPELVKDSEKGYRKVNYIELIPLIVSKMKDMQDEINELKKQLEEKNTI
jgi:hypothetical protein